MIEIGDQVATRKPFKNGEAVLLPKGSVGKVVQYLGKTREGPKFLIDFEDMPFRFNFWEDELVLVAKGRPRDRKKPRPEPPMHPQRAIKLGGTTIEVDAKLAPLIQGLFRTGILTCMSCQENEPGITWLQFVNTDHALGFVNKASKVVQSFCWDNNVGFVVMPDDDFGAVSVRFPLADLPKVKRLFPAR
jgi:hypothetical protein